MTPAGGRASRRRAPAPAASGYERRRFDWEGLTHDVWARGSGPPVMVVHGHHAWPGLEAAIWALRERLLPA